MAVRWNHTIASPHSNGHGRCCRLPVWNMSAVRNGRRVVSFPYSTMGQYFKAVNTDKKEVVCPWCLSGGAKLWEWAANTQGAVLTLLLRKSSGSGGGDYYGYRTQKVNLDSADGKTVAQSLLSMAGMEGRPIDAPADALVGRWAGDRVVLIGDYDESKLWHELPAYRNISEELVRTWNGFMDLDHKKLEFNPTCSCQENG